MTELPPDAGPVDRLRPGTLLREWRIGRFIARGAFGQVFEAHRASWMADEPPRALKVFDPIMSSATRAALVGEFDVLRGTRHPNLLRGEDAFDVEDGPFAGCVVFVLELADTDLASELGRRGPLPAGEVATIGAQAASGLGAMHAGGHLHGDVKPANLLRVGPTWKLGDFGVSSAVQGSYSVAPGATLDYTPPELSTEPEGFRVHRSADVWALGVTLWMVAAGQHPFLGATPYTRLAAALRGDRAPATIDADLAQLIDCCCLVPDPRRRVRAAELAERLDALAVRLTGSTTRARPASGPMGFEPARPGPAQLAAQPTDLAEPAPPLLSPWRPTRQLRPEAPPTPVGHPAPVGAPAWGPPGPAPVRPPAWVAPPGMVGPPAPAAQRPPGAGLSWAERWRRIRLGLSAALAVVITAMVVQLSSLAAAATPFDLSVRRTIYLVLAVLALVAIGWVVRRLGSAAARWFAAAGAATTLLVGTGWLFWGG